MTHFLSKQGFLKLRSHIMVKWSEIEESWITIDRMILSSERVKTRSKMCPGRLQGSMMKLLKVYRVQRRTFWNNQQWRGAYAGKATILWRQNHLCWHEFIFDFEFYICNAPSFRWNCLRSALYFSNLCFTGYMHVNAQKFFHFILVSFIDRTDLYINLGSQTYV